MALISWLFPYNYEQTVQVHATYKLAYVELTHIIFLFLFLFTKRAYSFEQFQVMLLYLCDHKIEWPVKGGKNINAPARPAVP